jgi:hypothetical protein
MLLLLPLLLLVDDKVIEWGRRNGMGMEWMDAMKEVLDGWMFWMFRRLACAPRRRLTGKAFTQQQRHALIARIAECDVFTWGHKLFFCFFFLLWANN